MARKKGAIMLAVDELDRSRGPVVRTPGSGRVGFGDPVVAQRARIEGQVLEAAQSGTVAMAAQKVRQVPFGMLQEEVAVGQSQLPAGVGALAGEQTGPARRAGGRSAEGPAKENAFLCQPLDVGRGDRMAVGLKVSACVVGMQVDDVHGKVPQYRVCGTGLTAGGATSDLCELSGGENEIIMA